MLLADSNALGDCPPSWLALVALSALVAWVALVTVFALLAVFACDTLAPPMWPLKYDFAALLAIFLSVLVSDEVAA
jgi:hypothetical protein